MPGSWLSVLLSAVSVLIQRQHQLGIARAGQYAVPIQGVFADDVGEAGSGLIAGVCTDDLADGAGQGLAGASGYVVVNLHGFRQRLITFCTFQFRSRGKCPETERKIFDSEQYADLCRRK